MKIALITSNIGNIDDIKKVITQYTPYDYYCFDRNNLPLFPNMTDRLLSKYPKLNAHKLLPDYDVYIWIDGRVAITSPLFIDRMTRQLEDVIMARHPDRANVLQEYQFIIKNIKEGNPYLTERYEIKQLQRQAGCFDCNLEQLPLYSCGIFARRNTHKLNIAFEEIWNKCLDYGNLDQPLYSYIERKYSLSFGTINYYNQYFQVLNHIPRKIIYTAIIGNYDNLIEMPKQNSWRYLCFTDQNLTSDTWEIIKVSGKDKLCRQIKLLPHIFLPPHEISVWIDGNIEVDCNLDSLIHADYCLMKRPRETNIYEEAQILIDAHKEQKEIIDKQINQYNCEFTNIPGLMATGVLIRRNTIQNNSINEKWCSEVERHSKRDQLSFPYIAHKYRLKYQYINWLAGFKIHTHKENL